ncbi:unnamed protein product [Sphagnum jensenii]|uniref:RRM domain-containing protein n=1 Tax=Sphagnum jensenii TaxID=128206 RepID=A0ABP0X1P9_9BRYO
MVLDHNGKQVLLDPNAREYTPPPQSLCAAALAPVLPPAGQHPYAAASVAIQPFISMGCPTMTFSGNNSLASTQQPSVSGREHVSRALLLNGVPSDMDEHQLKQEMELWGPVRAMGMERIKEGLVIVHYYDLRHTKEALADIQQQHLWYQQRMQRQLQRQQQHRCSAAGLSSSLPSESRHHDRQERAAAKHAENRGGPDDSSSWGGGDVQGVTTTTRGLIAGKVMWAQYTVAVGAAAGADGLNQGTLVVFNLDAEMSLETLQAAFEKYGTVKELRETPAKKMHKFVEFYDVRDAAKALKALDNQEIGGKKVKIEFSRPGGQAYKARVQAQQAQVQNQQQNAPPLFAAAAGTTGYNSGFSSAAAGTVVGENCVSLASESLGREENSLASQTRGGDGPVPAGRRKRNLANSSSGFAKCEPMIHLQGGSGGGKMMGSRDGPSSTGRSCLPMKCLSNESVPLQYMFDEKELQSDESTRTTLMIRNIPNKYSQAMLLQLLDRHCLHSNSHLEDPNEPESAYDFVYLPIDFKNRCNLGYAFVNFTTVEATKRLYKAFHAQQWEAFNSRKVCQVSYARVQGRVALEEHFRNSRFACDNDEYLPLCFSPPRTGSTQSQPTVAAGHLVGRAMGSSIQPGWYLPLARRSHLHKKQKKERSD